MMSFKLIYVLSLILFINYAVQKEEFITNTHSSSRSNGKFSAIPDTSSFKEMFSSKYIVEEHNVTTEDGYMLLVFRVNLIESEKAKLAPEFKKNIEKVVFIQHGLFGSADAQFFTGENKSAGFHIVNRGYDVWVGNERGNTYSSRHVNPNIKYKDFYDYSFDEVALFDVPAVYEHILANTSEEKIIFIGYSQGTTVFIASAVDDKTSDYIQSKTKKFIAVAPTVYMNNVNSYRFYFLASLRNLVIWFNNLIGVHQMLPNHTFPKGIAPWLTHLVCDNFPWICSNFIPCVTINTDHDVIFDDIAKVIVHHPAGTSAKNFYQYMQMANMVEHRKFPKYDHGVEGNMKKYGQKEAPYWDVSKFTVDSAFLLGKTDEIVTAQDAYNQMDDMENANVKAFWLDDYNHLTFAFPRNPDVFNSVQDKAMD